MTNEYRIEGNKVYIKLTSRIQPAQEVIIPLDQLATAQAISGDWYLYKHQRTGKYYARGNDKSSGKLKQPLLHRLLMQPARGQNTAHIDGDTLNCMTDNMINVLIGADVAEEIAAAEATKKAAEAAQIAKADTPTDLLGDLEKLDPGALVERLELLKSAGLVEKGVAFHKGKRKWEVSPFYNGTRQRLGYWPATDLDGANNAVIELRELGPDDYYIKYPKKGKVGK